MTEEPNLADILKVAYRNFQDIQDELDILAKEPHGRKGKRYIALLDSADKMIKRICDLKEQVEKERELERQRGEQSHDLIALWEKVQELEAQGTTEKRQLLLRKDAPPEKLPLVVQKDAAGRSRKKKKKRITGIE